MNVKSNKESIAGQKRFGEYAVGHGIGKSKECCAARKGAPWTEKWLEP